MENGRKNTDRLWFTVGAILLGAVFIFGFNSSAKATVTDVFEKMKFNIGLVVGNDPYEGDRYMIREADEGTGDGEVWVAVEATSMGHVRIVDAGSSEDFSKGTRGSGLSGELAFPSTVQMDESDALVIEEIGKSAFQRAQFDQILQLPSDLIVLDDYSLQQSPFSGEAVFPENLEVIGVEALRDSTFSGGLDTLPNVKEIREDAFKESEFTDSDLSELGKNADELVLADGSLGKYRPEGTFKLPNNITTIGGSSGGSSSGGLGSGSNGSGSGSGGSSSGAFNSSGITGIDFSGVTDLKVIGDGAFKDAKITGTLKIPKTVQAIGKEAFKESNITKLDLTEVVNLEEIGDGAFENSRLTGILFLPNSIKRIGDRAFYESIFVNNNWILPDKLEFIGDYAFYNSQFTGKFDAEQSTKLKYIGNFSFYNSYTAFFTDDIGEIYRTSYATYNKNHTISLPDSLEYIGNSSFQNAGFTGDFTIPKNTKYIGNLSFYNSFRSFILSASSTPVNWQTRSYLFYYFSRSLFKFNENIEYIGNNAFYYAHFKNDSDIIPQKLHTIGEEAFNQAFKIESVSRYTNTSNVMYRSPEKVAYTRDKVTVGKALVNNGMPTVFITE